MAPPAKTDAIRFFTAQLGIFCEAGLVVNVQALAPLVANLAAELASVGIALAAGALPLMAAILFPLSALGGCAAFPAHIFLTSLAPAYPSSKTLVARTEMMSVPSHARSSPHQWLTTLRTLASHKTALPSRIVFASLVPAHPSCLALSIATKLMFVSGYPARFSHQWLTTLRTLASHKTALPARVVLARLVFALPGRVAFIITEMVLISTHSIGRSFQHLATLVAGASHVVTSAPFLTAFQTISTAKIWEQTLLG